MPSGRHMASIVLVALTLLAGCGDDDGDGDGSATKPQPSGGQGAPVGDRGGPEAARAFVSCINDPPYKAEIANQVNASAIVARQKGYKAENVFVNSEEGAFYSFYVVFFASEAKREEATRERDLNFGSADVPAPDEKGSAVVTWTTKDAREKGKGAVDRCLG